MLAKTLNPRLEEVVAAYRQGLEVWSGWRVRKAAIRALVAGRFADVFPDDFSETDLLMVANLFRDAIEDGGRLFAEQVPSERVPASGIRDEHRAESVEQVMNGYTLRSRLYDQPDLIAMDLMACGLNAIKCWPEFGRPPEDRFPTFRRIDPDFILPEPLWVPDRPTDNVCVVMTDTVDRLSREFPEPIGDLMARITRGSEPSARASGYDLTRMLEEVAAPKELTVLEWYSSRYVARVCYYNDSKGREEAVLLSERNNETGLCPVQLAHRPSWSREPTGQLDDSKGIVRTQNRFMRLLLDYFVEMVYGGKLVWNVKNPNERGPGTRYFALGPDAKMEPVTPEIPSFQAMQILDRLEDAGRLNAIAPRARSGDTDLNKATAAFLQGAQGKLRSVVTGLQRAHAVQKRNLNEVALAQDQAWCNTRKKVFGIARGRRYAVTYTPADLIKDDYANTVTYGTRSGMDRATDSVIQLERLQARGLSLETYLENDPSTDDVSEELRRMAEGELRASLLAGMSDPKVPIQARAAAWKAFRDDKGKGDLDKVAEILMSAQAPAPTPALPGAPVGAIAASVGAQPGIAGVQGPPGPVLPPTSALRTRARGGRR